MTAIPTLKSLGNRVLRECAVPEVSSFNPGNAQSNIAFDALQDGYQDIWFRNRWEWQRYQASIALQVGVAEYPLPANFHRMAVSPWFGPTRTASSMRELTPEEFYTAIADTDPSIFGQPVYFTINHTTMHLWPTPSDTMVDVAPQLTFQYWMAPPERKTVSQESHLLPYIPGEFTEMLVLYAKSKLKQHLEFPDFERDMQLFEKKLATMMNRDRQVRRAPRMRTEFQGVREW